MPVTVSVPRNNRMAVMVNAARANFGGDSESDLGGSCRRGSLRGAGRRWRRTRAVCRCCSRPRPTRRTAGALADLIGRPVDQNVNVVGHLQQRTMLVRGQNNRDVWGHDAQRMAVAVTEEAPFSIEIVQPQVPIVRNGAMQLKVVATRKEGFNEPIAVYMLYNPPGIGSSGSISIPADQNEVDIPLTANGSAAIGTWPIIVLGRAQVGNGNIDVASQQAPIWRSPTSSSISRSRSRRPNWARRRTCWCTWRRNVISPATATAELLGLPAKTALVDPKPLEFTQETRKNWCSRSRLNRTRGQASTRRWCAEPIVTMNGEPIVHTLGSGELRS